jgi:hypothetical protein
MVEADSFEWGPGSISEALHEEEDDKLAALSRDMKLSSTENFVGWSLIFAPFIPICWSLSKGDEETDSPPRR